MSKTTKLDRTIFPLVFLGFLGLSLQYPILAPLFLKSDTGFHFYCLPKEILFGMALAIFPFAQFIGAPVLGTYADMVGRKQAFKLIFIMLGFGHLLSAFAVYHGYFLFFVFSRFLTGFFECITPVARAIASEIEDKEYKLKIFGRINASITLAYLIGPLVTGLLSVHYIASSSSYVYFITSFFANYIALVMLYSSKQSNNNLKKFNIARFENKIKTKINYIIEPLFIRGYLHLFAMTCLITVSFNVFYKFLPVLLVKVMNCSTLDIAFSTFVIASSMVFSQVYLNNYLSKKYCSKTLIIYCSLVLASLMVLAANSTMYSVILMINIPLGILIGIIGINIPIYISSISSAERQGQIMGLMLSLKYLAEAMFTIIGGLLSLSSSALPIYCGAIFICFGVAIFNVYLNKIDSKSPSNILI